MKKKFSLLILSIFYLFNLNISAYAKPACDLFYEDIKNNFDKFKLDSRPLYEKDDYGFTLEVKFSPKLDEWLLDTDKDGYFLQTTKKRGEQMQKSFKNTKHSSFSVKLKEHRDFEGKQYPHESNINK